MIPGIVVFMGRSFTYSGNNRNKNTLILNFNGQINMSGDHVYCFDIDFIWCFDLKNNVYHLENYEI